MKLKGQVALVTGGNRGIGLAIAQLFSIEGARVMITGRDAAAAKSALAHVPGAQFVACDVRRSADCERAVNKTLEAFGQLHILVNNAGIILRNRSVEGTTEEEWDAILETNVKGTYLMSRCALPHLRAAGGGVIVNMASYLGLVGARGLAAYSASKGAVINLTRAMALDHAAEHIRVNCICPGSVATDMLEAAWNEYGDVEQAEQVWKAKHPLMRVATADEIARVALFLASEDSSFVTGAAIPVDGGITAG